MLPLPLLAGTALSGAYAPSCNTDLSIVDKGLAEHSPVALSKVAETPVSAFKTQLGGHASFESVGIGPLTVRVGNQMRVDVRPQLRLVGNRVRVVAPDRESMDELAAFIDKQIAKGRLLATRIEIADAEDPPRYCMHRSDDAIVSCASAASGAGLLRSIEDQWPHIKQSLQTAPEQRMTAKPEVQIKMTFRPNDEYRGVAKIAFETTAVLLGSAFVLRGMNSIPSGTTFEATYSCLLLKPMDWRLTVALSSGSEKTSNFDSRINTAFSCFPALPIWWRSSSYTEPTHISSIYQRTRQRTIRGYGHTSLVTAKMATENSIS